MYRFLHTAFEKIILREPSVHKLTASSCMGIFLACSPFLGIQLLLASIISWLLRLNTALVIIVLCLVNNPITMIPIILIDYFVGYIVLEKIFHASLYLYEPAWLARFNTFISECCAGYVAAASFSIWNYFVGGVIFALICSITSYPALYALFKYMKQHHKPSC